MSISSRWLVVPLLLLAACGPAPRERARLAALHRLRLDVRPPAKLLTESLAVYDFSQDTVRYFGAELPSFGEDGHLVTYQTSPAEGAAPRRQALYVDGGDSVLYYLPVRHAAEFERRYHVPVPAPTP